MNLHLVERYRLVDYAAAKDGFERDAKQHNVAPGMPEPNATGKYLQLEFTVEDPGVFTMPWKGLITYRRAARKEWEERICAENIEHYYGATQYYSDKNAHVPMADRPDF